MHTISIKNNDFVKYLIKFIGIFCLLYFGTLAVIGLVSPGGKYYFSFLDEHLNYIAWLRASLLFGTKQVFSIIGLTAYTKNVYTITILNGKSIHIVYSCLGYGVMSFWAAFVLANDGSFIKKTSWLLLGLLMIWGINVFRLFLFLLAINNNWSSPFGLNHHTLFTIFAYCGIFIMIYFFDKSDNKILKEHNDFT